MIADRCEGLQHVLGSSLDRIAFAPFTLALARLLWYPTRTPPPLFFSLISPTE